MKSFFTSQFGYCPLVWMFHSRSLNNKINFIYERALRITYGGKTSTFQQLLEKDNSISIHHRNLQILAAKMFKISNNLSPEIVKEILQERFVPCNYVAIIVLQVAKLILYITALNHYFF